MWGAAVPNAISALVTALKNSPDLDADNVLDGAEVSGRVLPESVVVGLSSLENDPTAAEGQFSLEGMAVMPNRERFVIRCEAMVINGTTTIAEKRDRVFQLLAAAGQAIAANHTLGGAVLNAYISDYRLIQPQSSDGAGVAVLFGVTCDAFTRS